MGLIAGTPIPVEYTMTVHVEAIRKALAELQPGDTCLRFSETLVEEYFDGERSRATRFKIEAL